MKPMTRLLVMGLLAVTSSQAFAQDAASRETPARPRRTAEQREAARKKAEREARILAQMPKATAADVAYGSHPKQVLTFWKAETTEPAPLLFYIHGGGWRNGNRNNVSTLLPLMLKEGISVVSVEYRFVQEAQEVEPPVKAPLHDAARALQFVRSKASEWNIDKTRIAASGGSAGACTSLWLAFHDDLADPNSSDPVARESTRLLFAAVSNPQTSLDPHQMREWIPNSRYGAHAFKVEASAETLAPLAAGKRQEVNFQSFYDQREKILPWIREYSPYELVSPGDSPVAMYFNNDPDMGQPANDPTHSANFGVGLKAHMDKVGVPCELVYPGARDAKYPKVQDYLIAHLKKKS